VNDSAKPSIDGGRLAALAVLARRALMVERLWPPLVFALAVLILFLAASWAGLWQFAPRAVRIGGLVLFALGCGIALSPLMRLRRPAARDVLARLDRDSHTDHRPASSLADTLANDHGDHGTQALWAAHKARLERAVEAIRVAPPAPRMVDRDPYALRFGVAMLAFAAAVVAGPEMYGRLASAFDWRSDAAQAAAAESRIDAWIDPPPYAGRPPVVVDFKSADPQTLTVPEDSVLVVRGVPDVVETRVDGGIAPSGQKNGAPGNPASQQKNAALANAPVEKRWTIHEAGKATILRGGSPVATVVLAVTPAGKPTIVSTEEPHANLSGSLTLAYRTQDRFGLAGARAEFTRQHEGAGPAPRTLAPPPQAALQLPPTANGVGDAKTTVDLSEHPWAGAKVTMRLSVVSISGKTGESAPIELTLPQRIFHNPLARALIEQRRNLILDPDHAPKEVMTALTGLMIAPELFDTPASVYLGLKEAKSSLEHASSDADLLNVAALLWAMAQQLEDGDATQAQRDLRAAEQALREALQRGASDQEIRKLMQQLRDAANRFMSEMARNSPPMDTNAQDQNLQAQDLDRLLDQMEDTARNGSREDAEAMLDQMQEMFENMRSAREAQESPGEREMRKQIGELEKLLRDQQKLRDDTFRSDQRDRARRRARRNQMAPGQRDFQGQQDQEGSNAPDQGDNDSNEADNQNQDQADQGQADQGQPQLGDRQQELRDRLAELQRKLKGLGMKGEKGFDDAQGDMKEAEGDLKGGKQGQSGQSGKGAAVDAQGRALEALREGAQGLQKQMDGQGQGKGRNGRGNYVARRGRPGERYGEDPLGRGAEGDKGREEGPLKESMGAVERARRVMEELRRRLADPARPVEERDYLERLMKRDY
jgi:uncharacterized protein (TIGR02302 family)